VQCYWINLGRPLCTRIRGEPIPGRKITGPMHLIRRALMTVLASYSIKQWHCSTSNTSRHCKTTVLFLISNRKDGSNNPKPRMNCMKSTEYSSITTDWYRRRKSGGETRAGQAGNHKAMDCKMIFASSRPTFACPLVQVILLFCPSCFVGPFVLPSVRLSAPLSLSLSDNKRIERGSKKGEATKG
jgi:hypothetical protein